MATFTHSSIYRRMSVPERWLVLSGALALSQDQCWPWLGRTDANGYASLKNEIGQSIKAHRYGYELIRGPIYPGKELDHLCHTFDPTCLGGVRCPHRRCVNVWHLEVVTTRVNILRGLGRGAREARMTKCLLGHPLSGENLYIRPSDGKRRCRICNSRSSGIWRRRLQQKETDYLPEVET